MRPWLKWLLAVVGIFVLATVSVYVYIFHLGGLERLVIKEVNKAIAQPGNLRVSLDRIEGDFFTGISVDGLTIEYADSTRSFTLARVDHASAEYASSDLLRGQIEFEAITLQGVELTIARDTSGQWLIPIPSTPQVETGSETPFAVDSLVIADARLTVERARDTLTVTDLNLAVSVRREGPSLSMDVKRLRFESSEPGLSLDAMSGRATLTGENLLYQDLLLTRGLTRFKASGAMNLKQLSGDAELSVDGLVLEQIQDLTGTKLRGEMDLNGGIIFSKKGLSGHLNVGGTLLFADLGNLAIDFTFADKLLSLDTVYGTILGTCGIDGRGEVDFSSKPEEYLLNANVRNLNLKQIAPGTFESDLTGRLELHGRSFSNATMVLDLNVDLYESSFDQFPLQRAVGPMRVTTASLTFPEPFQVDYFENRFEAVGSIDYRGVMNLEVDALLANLDRYRGKLFIDQPGGRGHGRATLSGSTSDPNLAGRFWSDSLWVYGLYADSAYAEYEIDRFLGVRQGMVEVNLLSGAAWDIPYDSGFALISLDSTLVHLDSVGFISPYARLVSRGLLDQTPYPWRLTLDTLTLSVFDHTYFNRSQMLVEIDTSGFNFISTTIGQDQASITANRRVDFDETMDVTVNVAGIPLAPWLHLFKYDYDFDGVASAELSASGSFADPILKLNGSMDSVIFRGERLGRLTASANYRGKQVTIDSVVMKSDQGVYRVEGGLAADLALSRGVEKRFPDLPFDLTITANDNDSTFRLVPLLLPSVEYVGGDFHADLKLNGTPRGPHLDGQAFLRNGRMKYLDLAEILHTDSVSFIMRDNKIILSDVRAYAESEDGRKRYFAELSGDLTVNAIDSFYYNIAVVIPQEFPFKYDLDDIEGVVMDTLFVRGETPPTVSGRLTLASGKYQVEFAEKGAGSPFMLALSGENMWDLDINIEIPSNYWIKNEDIDAEFGGFLNIIREKGKYRFVGELEILRGRGYLFDKTFSISPDSSRVIFEDVEYPNPRLDIWASTRVPLARTSEQERSYEDVKVHVTGNLDNPEFAFFLAGEEDVPISYEAIVPLIVANYYGDAASSGAFEERVSQLISSQVSQIGTRRLGVETFEIDPTYEGYLDLAQTRVTVGDYVFLPNLYLWGRTPVQVRDVPEGGFEYRISKALLLEGLRDENLSSGESYRLNLKMHWEFK